VTLDLTATVDANVTGYERQIDNAINATRRYEASLNSLEADMMALEKSMDDHVAQSLQRQHDALDKTGKALLGFGLAATAVMGLAAREAVQWESAWAGVTKTTDGTAEQMAGLEEQLRGLALVLPATHEEIAATAEAAGQLGVAREDIAAFTRTALDLGETTNLSAEAAATAIAQMMNVMKSAPDVVDEIGSTLVALGNDGASTEEQILSMAQRLTGAVALIGGTEADVLGLASAMSNLGIQAELGGGAMSRTILTIFEAVEQGGDKLDAFARFSGTTASEFAAAWSDDPVRALDLFIQGMASSRAEGRNLIGELEDLGLKGTQNMQVLLRLAGAGTELTDALDLSSSAWSDNTALIEEAGKRYATTEAQIQIARNQMRDAAIDIGAVVLPAIAAVVDVGGDLAQAWRDMPEPLRDVVIVLGLAATAATVFGGAAMIAVPKIAAFKATVDGLSAGALKTAGTRLTGLAGVLAGPWGLALGAGVTALTIFAAKHGDAAREVQALKDTLDQQTGALTRSSQQMLIDELYDAGVLDQAKQLGLDLGVVTDAALGNAEAMASVNAVLDQYGTTSQTIRQEGDAVIVTTNENAAAAIKLRDALDGTNSKINASQKEWSLETEAKEKSTIVSETATQEQAQLNATFEDGVGIVGDLTGELKLLGDELNELSGNYLENREAGRSVREALREIRRETREYVKEHGDLDGAFRAGTASGDAFAALLDGLAVDLQNQITATERLTGSEDAVMRKYRESRRTLIDVAEQLGLSEQAAKDYADRLLGTPENVRTHFQLEGLPQAREQLTAIETQLLALQAIAAPTFGLGGFAAGLTPPDTGRRGGQAPPAAAPDFPPRSGRRAGTWSAASQQLAGGGRAPQPAYAGRGGDIDYDRLIDGLGREFGREFEQTRAALDQAHELMGRGMAKEANRGWSEAIKSGRAAALGGRPHGHGSYRRP
jgi:TP901 family phage tail tape measure protein